MPTTGGTLIDAQPFYFERLALSAGYLVTTDISANIALVSAMLTAAGFRAGAMYASQVTEEDGYTDGERDGTFFGLGIDSHNVLISSGFDDGDASGFARGRALGIPIGLGIGFGDGYEDGYTDGTTDGQRVVSVSVASTGGGGGGGEVIPPVSTPISPLPATNPGTPGAFPLVYVAAKNTPILLTVVDADSAVGYVTIAANYSDRVASELVYAGRPAIDGNNGFRAPYAGFSLVTGTGAATVGNAFSIRNDNGWPGRPNAKTLVTLSVSAVDSVGNVLA